MAQLELQDFAPACLVAEPDELRDLARLDGVPDPLFRLLTANPRHPHLLDECADLQALLEDGYTAQDICEAVGLNKAALDRRLRMARLIPALAELYRQGGVSNVVAEACAKLPEAVQHQLAELASANGKLTSGDVTTLKRARASEAVAQLPDELFAPEPQDDWRARARTNLHAILTNLPAGETDLRADLHHLLAKLEGKTICERKSIYQSV